MYVLLSRDWLFLFDAEPVFFFRFSGDFDHLGSPSDFHAENRNNHNAHLISMQAKLARDAVASVYQQAGKFPTVYFLPFSLMNLT